MAPPLSEFRPELCGRFPWHAVVVGYTQSKPHKQRHRGNLTVFRREKLANVTGRWFRGEPDPLYPNIPELRQPSDQNQSDWLLRERF